MAINHAKRQGWEPLRFSAVDFNGMGRSGRFLRPCRNRHRRGRLLLANNLRLSGLSATEIPAHADSFGLAASRKAERARLLAAPAAHLKPASAGSGSRMLAVAATAVELLFGDPSARLARLADLV